MNNGYRILDVEVHEYSNDNNEHFVLLAFPDTFSAERVAHFTHNMERIYAGFEVVAVTGSVTSSPHMKLWVVTDKHDRDWYAIVRAETMADAINFTDGNTADEISTSGPAGEVQWWPPRSKLTEEEIESINKRAEESRSQMHAVPHEGEPTLVITSDDVSNYGPDVAEQLAKGGK